jgi:hypothetical protein
MKKTSNELFLQLRAFSAMFHGVHELQAEQLKRWPYAVDPNVEKSNFKLDFEKKLFVYEWEIKKDPPSTKAYAHRLDELLKGVRFLFGDDWSLTIQNLTTGTTIFTSENVPGKPDRRLRNRRNRRQKVAKRR